MLSIRSSYNSNNHNNYEADEIQSSSSSLSFGNNESYYQDTSLDTIMNGPHTTDLTYHNSDWSINKSPQQHSFRDDPSSSYSTSYHNYDNSISNVVMNTTTPVETVYHHMSWPSSSSLDEDNNNSTVMVIPPPPKLDSSSTDLFLHSNSRKQQQYHLLNIFPPPPPHQTTNMENIFSHQRPNYHQATIIPHHHHNHPQKGEKYHPRFKSANARLSPYTEQQQKDMYHQLSTSSSSPPHISLMDEDVMVDQFYYNYQMKNIDDVSTNDQTSFQFDVVLHASTAVKKKHDEQSVTYLNRGQAYLIDLTAISQQQQQYPGGTMSSTISIAFHEPSHRQIAENYWKYWISQQECPKEARSIDLDTNQTTGIYNIRLVTFDRVSFDWHSRFGAKVYIRFNCLSTDFSRIKGVKGIPLRCVMETNSNYVSLPSNSMMYKGTFQKLEDQQELYQYKEICYCKIKLFRDKGAERKNKDDKKQMAKQMEKVIASTNGNPQQHPLWPIISQSHKSTSILSEVPSSPDVILDDFDDSTLMNIMVPTTATNTTVTTASPLIQQNQSKRKRTTQKSSSKKETALMEIDNTTTKKSRTALCFYVWTRHVHSSPHEVHLEQLTTHDLKTKLGDILSIHSSRISEILWKRKKSDVLVLVEDTFISEHIVDGEMMTVDLEIKADGNLRLVLEF